MIGVADEVEVTTDDEANRIGATTKDPTVDIPGARNKTPSSKQQTNVISSNVCDTFATTYFIIFLDEVEVTTADAAVGNGNTTEDPTADIPGARDEVSSGKVMVKILDFEIKQQLQCV